METTAPQEPQHIEWTFTPPNHQSFSPSNFSYMSNAPKVKLKKLAAFALIKLLKFIY